MEPTSTSWPGAGLANRWAAAAWARWSVAPKLVRRRASMSLVAISSKRPDQPAPAQETTRSRPPRASTAAETTPAGAPGPVRSAGTVAVNRPACWPALRASVLRPDPAMTAPRLARTSQVAQPIPLEAPVTSARRPFRERPGLPTTASPRLAVPPWAVPPWAVPPWAVPPWAVPPWAVPRPRSFGVHQGTQGLAQAVRRGQHRAGLVTAVRHAVAAAGVASPAVLGPVGRLHQFLVGLGVTVGQQVARALPAEDGVGRDAPGGALELHLALQEVQEQWAVVEPPVAALALEGFGEQLGGLVGGEETDLVGGFFVGVAGGDHHGVHAQLVVQEIEHLTHRLGGVGVEERGVGRHLEALGLSQLYSCHGLVEDPVAADRLVVALAQAVYVDHPGEQRVRLEAVQLALHQ